MAENNISYILKQFSRLQIITCVDYYREINTRLLTRLLREIAKCFTQISLTKLQDYVYVEGRTREEEIAGPLSGVVGPFKGARRARKIGAVALGGLNKLITVIKYSGSVIKSTSLSPLSLSLFAS